MLFVSEKNNALKKNHYGSFLVNVAIQQNVFSFFRAEQFLDAKIASKEVNLEDYLLCNINGRL